MDSLPDRILVGFLRRFFHLLYHEFARTYDGVAWAVSMGEWNQWVRSATPYLPGPRVLELGSGPGHLQIGLAETGIQVVGLDASPQMSRQALRRLVRANFPKGITQAHAQALPFPRACFDQVAATFPTEYIYDPHTLTEIRRVLKPTGCLVVIPAGWIKGDAPERRLLRRIYKLTRQSPPAPSADLLERAQAPFRQAGFEVDAKILNLESADLLLILAKQQE